MSALLYMAIFFLANIQDALSLDWLNVSETELLKLRNEHNSYDNQKSDLLFLIDTSSSLSGSDFSEEKKFITNLLNVLSVGMEDTRVEVIPFGRSASIFIDQVSTPELTKNKCTFNEKFNLMKQSINGYTTNMKDAFQLAYDVCLGKYSGLKRGPLNKVKTTVILLTDGKWNTPWSDPSPVSTAQLLHDASVEVFAVGVGNINQNQLEQVVEDPTKQAFFLADFDQFSELATYLRGDPSEDLWQTQDVNADKCDNNCDDLAACACGLVYGDYKCSCPKGYYGSGVKGQCTLCPVSTYKDFAGYAESCTACPANSSNSKNGSKSIYDCKCFTGYDGYPEYGNDCSIRDCDKLAAPDNGKILGSCSESYLSTCNFECDEGYKLSGSENRTCSINENDTMVWSGTVKCSEILCGSFQSPIAATRNCTTQVFSYQTRCSFYCLRGYKRSGSETITCQLDGSWSPSPPTCEKVTCPALPSVSIGNYSAESCYDDTSGYGDYCTLTCPPGYVISYLSANIMSDTRHCLENGTWTYREISPTCKDNTSPTLSCPGPIEERYNDKGANASTVYWNFTYSDNSLTENEPGITEDSFTIVLTINDNNVTTDLPKLLGITGINDWHTVKYTVTDFAGNSAECSFFVVVKDTEAPTCGFCPTDIHIDNSTKAEVRVNWESPQCTDNSGKLPEFSSGTVSGNLFSVPGTYVVEYVVADESKNENLNCSFRITLENKKMLKVLASPKCMVRGHRKGIFVLNSSEETSVAVILSYYNGVLVIMFVFFVIFVNYI